MRSFLLLLPLCAFAAPCAAEVYRCAENGKVAYSDHPCAAGAQPLNLAPAATMSAPSAGEAEMAKQYEQEQAAEARASDAAAKQARKAYDARKAQEARVHEALTRDEAVPGMNAAQVRQVWGEPASSSGNADLAGNKARWIYRNGRETRTVSFENGVVTKVSQKQGKAKSK